MEEEKQTEEERLHHLGDELDRLQSIKNDGRGVTHLRYVVGDLKSGSLDAARADVLNQSDKFDSIPDIKKWVSENLFENVRNPWETEEDFKKRFENK